MSEKFIQTVNLVESVCIVRTEITVHTIHTEFLRFLHNPPNNAYISCFTIHLNVII